MMTIPLADEYAIAVRAYAVHIKPAKPETDDEGDDGMQDEDEHPPTDEPVGPSAWSLAWDTETETDAAQQLRVGIFQLRKHGKIRKAGFFYDPITLSNAERSTLYAYAARHGCAVYTVDEWVDQIFFFYVLDRNARCLLFNAPFDFSRIAIAHDSARGRRMSGGFTFQLSTDERRPFLRVKHRDSRMAFIDFAAIPGPRTPPGSKKKKRTVPIKRGYFVDVRTLAAALLAGSFSLHRLSYLLDTPHKKEESEEHGEELTFGYLDYAMNDVQVTWECFDALQARYRSFGL